MLPMGADQNPDMLYHYTSQAGFLGITKSRSFWASKIHYLNDGREFELSVDLVREYVAERQAKADAFEGLALQAVANIAGNVAQANICVASFTELGDLLSQWRGYCTPGDGLSIGLPKACIEASALALGWIVTRCTYEPAQQRAVLSELVDRHVMRLLGWLESASAPPSDPDDHALFNEAWAFALELSTVAPAIKDASFAEENEWRVISPPQDFRKMHYRPGRHTLIPYAELPILGMQGESVKVSVGPTAHPKLATSAAGGRLMQQGFTAYDVVASVVPFRDW